MSFKAFLKLTEIQTKVASVIPFLLGLAYTLYTFGQINVINMLIMFFAMILFDMTVTAINNYYDFKRAEKREGYSYEVHNTIVQYGLKPRVVALTILAMLAISAGLGIALVFRTNGVVLLLGMLCFAIGILYSFGPVPISRTPFGEMFSGITMGFILTFIVIYINVFQQSLFVMTLDFPRLLISMDIWQLFGIGVVCLPAVLGIAGIMLGNNICDISDDIQNKRHTLPVMIGKDKALRWLAGLYYFGFMAIVAGVVLGFLPLYALLGLAALIPVLKNTRRFQKKATKQDTFKLCVANFIWLSLPQVGALLLGAADGAWLHFLVR